jgi:thymidylate synthase
MSRETLPLAGVPENAAGSMESSGLAEEIVKLDFERIYAVYLDNLQQKASLFKVLISFVIAPYLVAVAFLSAKALEFSDISEIRELPAFLDFVIVVAGAGLLLPLFQYVEYDDNVMRTARAINNFRCLYADRLGISAIWKPNLPLDCTFPREREITRSGSVLVLVFMAISVVYVAKGTAGLLDVNVLSVWVIVASLAAAAALAAWYLLTGRNWRYESAPVQRGVITSITGSSAGRAWAKYLDHVVSGGVPLGNEPDPIVEAPPVAVTVMDVADDDPIVRRFGDQHVRELYERKMFSEEVVEELGTTYGDRLFNYAGHDQIAAAVTQLGRAPWSNKATLTLLDPLEQWPERRMPCLTTVDLKIRDAELRVFAFFRSQNVLNAYGNIYGLRAVQRFCAEQLGVPMGPLTLFVSSPHVFERDFERAKAIVGKC